MRGPAGATRGSEARGWGGIVAGGGGGAGVLGGVYLSRFAGPLLSSETRSTEGW